MARHGLEQARARSPRRRAPHVGSTPFHPGASPAATAGPSAHGCPRGPALVAREAPAGDRGHHSGHVHAHGLHAGRARDPVLGHSAPPQRPPGPRGGHLLGDGVRAGALGYVSGDPIARASPSRAGGSALGLSTPARRAGAGGHRYCRNGRATRPAREAPAEPPALRASSRGPWSPWVQPPAAGAGYPGPGSPLRAVAPRTSACLPWATGYHK